MGNENACFEDYKEPSASSDKSHLALRSQLFCSMQNYALLG